MATTASGEGIPNGIDTKAFGMRLKGRAAADQAPRDWPVAGGLAYDQPAPAGAFAPLPEEWQLVIVGVAKRAKRSLPRSIADQPPRPPARRGRRSGAGYRPVRHLRPVQRSEQFPLSAPGQRPADRSSGGRRYRDGGRGQRTLHNVPRQRGRSMCSIWRSRRTCAARSARPIAQRPWPSSTRRNGGDLPPPLFQRDEAGAVANRRTLSSSVHPDDRLRRPLPLAAHPLKAQHFSTRDSGARHTWPHPQERTQPRGETRET